MQFVFVSDTSYIFKQNSLFCLASQRQLHLKESWRHDAPIHPALEHGPWPAHWFSVYFRFLPPFLVKVRCWGRTPGISESIITPSIHVSIHPSVHRPVRLSFRLSTWSTQPSNPSLEIPTTYDYNDVDKWISFYMYIDNRITRFVKQNLSENSRSKDFLTWLCDCISQPVSQLL